MAWTETRLKYLAQLPIKNGLGESGQHEEPTWPRYIRTTDIAGPRSVRRDTFASLPPDVAREAPLERGDVLMSAAGTVGKTLLYSDDRPACYAGYLVRFRPKPDVDGRFISYWTETALFLDQIAIGKVTSTIDNFSATKYSNLSIRIPTFDEQLAIVDFLDAETARIDALIEKKRRTIELLEERLRAMVIDQLFGADARWLRVGRAVDLLPGFAFSSELFSSDAAGGVRLLRGINVAPGQTRWDESVYIDASLAQDVQRFGLAVGDLVIGMDRPVIAGGMRVAEISEADVPSLLVQRVARLRVNELAERDWIRLALMSPAFVAYFSPIVTGVSVPHISPEQIASFKLPLPERDKQRSILRRLLSVERVKNEVSSAAAAQIALLREHRQALITAAVTGQLDLAKAAA